MKLHHLGIFLVLLLPVFVSGCVSEDTPTKVETTIQQGGEVTTTTVKTTEIKLKIGETAKTSKVEVTVISANVSDYYEYYSDILDEYKIKHASPGKKFLLIEAEIRNLGSKKIYVGYSDFSATDSEGYEYEPEFYYGEDKLDVLKELYPNRKIKGKVIFEVPEGATGLKVHYDFGDIITGPKLATWVIE